MVTWRTIFSPKKLLEMVRIGLYGRVLGVFDLPDLDLVQTGLAVLLDVDVDREMSVDIPHLVEVALSDAGNEVLDNALHSA